MKATWCDWLVVCGMWFFALLGLGFAAKLAWLVFMWGWDLV